MRSAEDTILQAAQSAFARRMEVFGQMDANLIGIEEYYQDAIERLVQESPVTLVEDLRQVSEEILADRIEVLPKDRLPVVIVGGSFNSDQHTTRIHWKAM